MRALAPHQTLSFELTSVDPTGARAGILHTRRGPVATPVFMPVATHATIRGLDPAEVGGAGTQILLANTYHLMLRPGAETFQRLGGIHRFMGWDRLVLTDSGGYQIFSLEEGRTVAEHGATFRSFHDNSRRLLSPEISIATQQAIDSDIMMVLDECVASTVDEAAARAAMERTHRWALRSLAAKEKRDTGQALFAIVQGAVYPGLRDESAAFLTRHPFEGFAIGGLAVGEEKHHLHQMTAHVAAQLPESKPRYLMGVGTPVDLVECVRRGVDMFDCIIPTKMAQQGYAYTFGGLVRITRSAFRHSDQPLDASCDCPVCARFSRGYLHHLAHGKHSLAPRLLALHNVRHYHALMARLREAILAGRYEQTAAELLAGLSNKKHR